MHQFIYFSKIGIKPPQAGMILGSEAGDQLIHLLCTRLFYSIELLCEYIFLKPWISREEPKVDKFKCQSKKPESQVGEAENKHTENKQLVYRYFAHALND